MSAHANSLLITNLMEFGLSDKEAKIYISLLEFEIATVNQIAKASGINRSSAYVVLEALKKRGLVSVSDDKNIQQYIPTSPNMLLKSAEAMANKQEQIKKNIDAIVPDLKALHKGTKQKPIVRVFEGKDGLISLFEETVTAKEKLIRVVSSVENLIGIIPQDYFPGYIQRRYENKVKMCGIHPAVPFFEKTMNQFPKAIDEHVLIPEKNFKSPSDIAIFDDKIGYMSHQNGGTGVLIESKEMAEVMKSIFDLAFEGAKHIKGSKHILPR